MQITTSSSALIIYNNCRLNLYLPIFFEETTLAKIRKVFKMLAERPYQNEVTYETLNQFFPEWESSIKERLELTLALQRTAEKKLLEAQILVEIFNSKITKEAKTDLRAKKKNLRFVAAEVKSVKRAYEKYMKVKLIYEQAMKKGGIG